MSWRDRPYAHEGPEGGGPMHTQMGMGLPRLTPVVKWLLIINGAAFLIQTLGGDFGNTARTGWLSNSFGATTGGWWQVWRYVTFQFLHGGLWHIFGNMLGVFFLGPPLEGLLGSKRFAQFYLSCGVAAGVAYVLVGSLVGIAPSIPLVGASGGVYGIILAGAVFFPHFRIIFLFFPVPIRLAAGIIFAIMLFTVLGQVAAAFHGDGSAFQSSEFWSQVAHFGGAVTGGVWVWVLSRQRGKVRRVGMGVGPRLRKGAWERKMKQQEQTRKEVDRILQKIHDRGIQSLSSREKRTLKHATEEQRREEQRIGKS